jgi:glycine/D-amino acid oxidase-like deaminating enzyme
MLGSKLIVHNYGHGGAGITMSWGCAFEVLDVVREHVKGEKKTQVAVIGAGVMGLTAATLLRDAEFLVTIYAKDFIPNTTSNVAGGQWAPSIVDYEQTAAGKETFHRILRRSFEEHERRGKSFGVVRRPNFTTEESAAFKKVPKGVIPEPKVWRTLPFEKLTGPGYEYSTLLVEPPILLARLHEDLALSGVQFLQREFIGLEAVRQLREQVVINCTGLGSRKIWLDCKLYPIKGQLALLHPQDELRYLYSSKGYVFPRRDAVVVGGSYEPWPDDPCPDGAMCRTIIETLRKAFDGLEPFDFERPPWLIVDK